MGAPDGSLPLRLQGRDGYSGGAFLGDGGREGRRVATAAPDRIPGDDGFGAMTAVSRLPQRGTDWVG